MIHCGLSAVLQTTRKETKYWKDMHANSVMRSKMKVEPCGRVYSFELTKTRGRRH
jgi:hypothetical protein